MNKIIQHFFYKTNLPNRILCFVLLLFVLGISRVSAQYSVTGLFTDYKGYWTSKQGAINPVWPDNKNNLLAFTFNNINYSTGVNDLLLTSKLVSFTPGIYQAFPVKNIPLPGTASNFVGLGQMEDGVDNGGIYPYSVPVTVAQILTRGVRGLDMGSCITNIPSTAAPLSFNFGAITNDTQIGDGIPDILITQVAQATGALDQVYFEDGNGNLVGNKISIDQSVIPVIGTWLPDFYDPNTGVIQPGFIKTDRPIRIWAADASAFGINSSNYSQPLVLRYKLGGSSDPAFIAFNTKFISLVTANDDQAATTLNAPVNINILANDQPNNQAALSSYTVPASSAHGTIVKNANGTVTYTPNSGYYGQDTFTYTICTNINGTVTCDDAIVTINISPDVIAPTFSSGVNLRCQGTGNTSYTASSGFATSMAFAISPNNAGTVSTSAMTVSANVGTASATVTWAADYYGPATITAIAYGSNGPKSTAYNITVNQAPTLVAGGNATQTVCAGSPIASTTFTWGGSATDVTVTDLPAGLTTSKSGKVLTISGTPTVSGQYTVTTIGQTSPCGALSATGTITVNPAGTLITGGGNIDQSTCTGGAITPITYTWGGAATDVSYTSLPAGLTAGKNVATKVLTISGTPTSGGTYTVSTIGQLSPCTPAAVTSNITVNSSAGLVAGGGANNQTVCVGSPIIPITYSWSGAATDVTVNNLPAGLTASKSGNTLTISGAPTSAGNFSVSTVGQTAPCTAVSLSGTIGITTTPAPTASNQTFCEISNATVANLTATGTAVKWYSQLTGGTALASTAALANGTYYASQTINGCESPARASVTVTIYQSPRGFNDTKTLDCTGAFNYNIQTQNINSSANGGNSVPSSFIWTVNPNANVAGAANGSGNTINQTLVNTRNTAQTIIYTVTPKATVAGACDGNPFTITVNVPVCSSISITKSANVSSVNQAGNVINYSVTVANTGNTNQNNVVVSDPLLGGNLNNPVKIGNTDNILEKGESWTYTGTYTVLQADLNNNGNPTNNLGKISNTASVKTTELPAGKTATADVNIILNPAVTLVKTGTLNLSGNTISYLFTVKNTGNVTLNNLVLTDSKITGAITLDATTLAPGASTTATASYTIAAAEKAAGSVSNSATVTGNGNVSDISGTAEGNDNPTVTNTGVYAVDDEGTLSAVTGGVAVNNVLINDKVNGNQATLVNVTISQVSTTNPNITIDPATGKVNVLPGTPVGDYTLVYQIENKANPGNVKQATVKVHLITGALLAKDDTGSANSVSGGNAVANVLANDTYNGIATAPTLNDVTITAGANDSNGKVTLDPLTGKVDVAANTPAGIYTLTYTITDKLDASKTSTATIKVTVASGALLAKDDTGNANGLIGGVAVVNVLTNDSYNGTTIAPTLNEVNLSQISTSNPNVSLNTATGQVDVASNTPAGIYTVVYEISDKLDLNQKTTATVTITVSAPALVATADSGNANGYTGGTAVENVLVNDTYNGNPATLNEVKLSQVSTTNPNVTLDASTGKVNVAPNTPAGTYEVVYQIEDKLNPGQTKQATVTVTISAPAPVATADSGNANGYTGGTAVENVLVNDTYNGNPATLNEVKLSQVSTTNPNVTLDVTTGKVNVAPNTPAGTYELIYQIEDKLNPGQKTTVTVTVTVGAPAMVAIADSGNANGTGGTAVENVLLNDTYNGNPATLNEVKLSQVSSTNPNITLDITTGKVNVAPNTPAGTYEVVYQIEDKLNPGQKTTATVTITVSAPMMVATADSGNANGYTGGTAVENVLVNDTYNGNPATLNEVKLSQVSTTNPNVTLDVTTGKVNVAPNTPAGTYEVVYQIEDKLNPGQKTTATVTVTVGAPALVATNDSGNANGYTGGTAVENVLVNDTYNGNPATLNEVKLSQVSSTNHNITLDVNTGKVNVAPNTPAGTYELVYQIEDKLNPGQVKMATVTITVSAPSLVATADSGNTNGYTGGTAVENVLVNDSYNGNPATLNEVKLSQVSTTNPNVTLDITIGKVNVSPNTPAGTYEVVYQIEDKLNPGQVKMATVTITVSAPALVATADSGNANGYPGGTAVENVLLNDTYNGNPATLNEVKLSQVSSTSPNVTLDVTTGKVNVATNTPAGTYEVVYQIEDKLNPGQKTTATVTVTVGAPALVATNDSGNVNGYTGGTAVENVLANDTYNGNPATLTEVKLSQVSSTNPNITLDVNTGKVNVAPNTPAGTYEVVYQIEDKLNLGQKITATVTVTVSAPALVATADSGNANGYTGGTAVENVLLNDTYNGNPATLNEVKLSQVSTTNPNITLDATTGKVNVAPNTPAGTYEVVYQIEDKLNLGQKITATVTVTVSAPALVATADSGNANGYTGGTAVENVLLNDTYNGNPATLNEVKLSQISTTNPNVTLDVTTGKVNVAPNTPAGIYEVVYQIEDKLNLGQKTTATVTVTVSAPALFATADSGNANGYTGGTAVENVLVNDTYNGNPATLNEVKLSQVSNTNPNVTLDVTTGKVNVAPNTPAGTYEVVYQIEDKLNPGQKTTATVTVTVGAPVLVATADSGNANGYTGGTAVENVLLNDTYNGNPATLNEVKLSQISTTNPNVTLDVTTGKVNVAPNTPAGIYEVVYQIEDKLNLGQKTTATVTVTVSAPALFATADSGNANGYTGGTAVENVLVNDTYNGNPATLNEVKLSQVSNTNPNVTLDVTTGKVNVAPNTPAGTYEVVYQIEDKLNPGQKTTATVTVTVGAPVLVATADSGNANGYTGGTAVENVLVNDIYNGNLATLTEVKLSQISTTNPNVTLDVTTGKVNVAPNTPAGTYEVVYQIEDKLNPGQKTTATVTITVGAPTMVATADSGNANGYTGGTAVENVLANDTYNGNPATLNEVKLSQVSSTNPNITLDVTTGKVNVAPKTPAGIYEVVYQIEDKLNPGQTKRATVTVTVGAPVLVATADSGNANGYTGGTAFENVLLNDTYNGNPATLNEVKLSQVSSTNPNVTLDVTTGKVNVAPNTPAGIYEVVYLIEDKLNPGQTKQATVTVTISAPAMVATADSGNANGYAGGTAVENVLVNDTYNGNLATLNEVKLSQVSTNNPNITIDVTTGKVNVAPNTPAGIYEVVYQIEDKLNPGQVKMATVTVTVGAPVLVATADSGNANGYTGGTAVENVLLNDTYNGNPATLNEVKLSQVSTSNPNVTLDVSTGKVNIAPNTPAGTYEVVYQIEDKLNPGQTKTATVTITVFAPAMVATADSGNANGYTGGTAVENVLLNDTYNGNPATLNEVKLSQVSTTNPNVTLDITTGKVNVAPNTPAGTYEVVYQIEDKLNPGQTKQATVTVTVGAPALVATNDSGNANGYTGGTAVENVLLNDTYNGNPATLYEVKLSQVSNTNPNITLDVNTGKVNVAPNTPAGTYELIYQIEDKLNPGQTKQATVTVTVGTSAILAKDDSGTVNGFSGGVAVENILINDTYNNINTATLANVTLSQISTSNPKITIDVATGKVNVAAGTLPGIYNLNYQITDKLDATKSSAAVVTITIPNWITDLQISKTANVTGVESNGNIGYTINIKNNGPATVLSGESIGLIENLPAGLENITYSAIGGTYSSTGNSFTLTADLVAGQQVSLAVNGRVPAGFTGTNLVNSVSLTPTSKTNDPESVNNLATVTTPLLKGKIALIKTGVLSADGNNITYSFKVTNVGDVELNSITLTDAKLGLKKTFPNVLAAGASFTYSQVYILNQNDKDVALVTNSASVSAQTPAGNIITDVSGTDYSNDNPTETPVSGASKFTFTKVATAVGTKVGESIDYTFNITNTGTVTLSNLNLTDAAADAGSINPANISTLAPGASVTVTAKHTLTQIDVNQGSFTNQASVKVTDNKGNVINQVSDDPSTPAPNDPTVTKLIPAPGFTLTKSATNGATKAGDVINYNIVFKNTGNVTLSDITLVDANADAGSLTPASITSVLPGATVNITAKHTVKQSDVNTGGFSNQVSATVKDPKGNTIAKVSDDPATPAADDATFTAIVPDPSVRFTKMVANSAGIVKTIEYSIQVTNTGNITLTDIVVTDPGADAGSITPSVISKLEPAETAMILARHTLIQSEIDYGKFINQAGLTAKFASVGKLSKLSDDPKTLAPDDPTVFLIKEAPGLALIKTGVLSADGNSVTYTFTAKNTGNVTLTNFSLVDPKISSNITFSPASIAPDEIATATAVYTISQAEKNASSVRNTATLTATSPAGTSISDVSGTEEDNDYPTILELPKIVSAKTVTDANNNGKAEANEILTYTITVKNNGNTARTGVKIVDPIPANTTYVNASADHGGILTGNTINWSNLIIPANGQVVVNFKVSVNAALPSGTLAINNTASVTDPANASTPLNPAVSIPTEGMLEGSKAVTDIKGNKDGRAQANEILTYSLTVKNTGGSALNGVTIIDELPAGLTYVPGSVSGYGTVMGNTLKWTINMQANSSTVLNLDARVAPDVNSYNIIKNVAVMTAPNGKTLSPEAAIEVDKSADLMVTKELLTKGEIKTGSDVMYKITVTNKGPNRATGVTITDRLSTMIDAPKEITVTIGTTTYSATTRDFVWLAGSLDFNQTATLTFKSRTLAAGALNNSAMVKADQPDPVNNNNLVLADAATISGDDLLIPNLFTPNGDGINDTFEINGLAEFAENELTIVNRWGNEVFRAKGYKNNWTGEGLNEGTYYYLLRAKKGGNNEWKVFKGYITLIRAFKN
ncbi:DUF7507 domain-containing protein [Pedobacter sp. 22226]|uniref:DUF7507 domain-containing protein n=1 Tax=Pedobacter sp. 22226 TaxID=3453894 RepID=UPI003F86424E